jgi:hypothetical protein
MSPRNELESPMNARRKGRVFLVVAAVALFGVWAVEAFAANRTSPGATEIGEGAALSTTNVLQTVVVDGLSWQLVSWDSEKGTCLHARIDGRDDELVGGCGEADGPFRWFVGSLNVEGTYYTAVFGDAPDVSASSVRLTFSDDSTVDIPVSNGTWLTVARTDSLPASLSSIDAVSSSGEIVAHIDANVGLAPVAPMTSAFPAKE